jgi:hypothetical protein
MQQTLFSLNIFCIFIFWVIGFFGLDQVALWCSVSGSYTKQQLPSPLSILLNHFCRHQSFKHVPETIQCFDALIGRYNKRNKTNTRFIFFKSSTNVLSTVSLLVPFRSPSCNDSSSSLMFLVSQTHLL